MKTEDKLYIEANRLLGEFIGTLEGIVFWEIPQELKLKLEAKITELKNVEILNKNECKNVESQEIFNNRNNFAQETSISFVDWYDKNSWCRPDVLKDEWIQYFPSKNQYLPPITLEQLYHRFISDNKK